MSLAVFNFRSFKHRCPDSKPNICFDPVFPTISLKLFESLRAKLGIAAILPSKFAKNIVLKNFLSKEGNGNI